jgi:hypothetical protein
MKTLPKKLQQKINERTKRKRTLAFLFTQL